MKAIYKGSTGYLKVVIGIGLKVKKTEDKSLDIQVQTAKIDAESKNML